MAKHVSLDPTYVKGAAITVPAVAVAAPTKAEYDALRLTVVALRDAIKGAGITL